MAKVLVTGGAGFIGSRLAAALADSGPVRVVDCLTGYYDVGQKRANLAALPDSVEVVEADLRTCELSELLDDVDVVFHQAGQPGVRLSWADGFPEYQSINIGATQRLLEACQQRPLSRFVYASSSSVYGDAERYPTQETDVPGPRSPYGVTKLAGEHLCSLYGSNWGLPTVSLRYFTVYGPGQRPDMAFHRLFEATMGGEPFPMFGDGSQIRDFTFVDDVVAANVAAASADLAPGSVINIAGGSTVSLAEVIETVGEISGADVPIEAHPEQAGDVMRTGGATDRARAWLGWEPRIGLRAGLEQQYAWHRQRTAPGLGT